MKQYLKELGPKLVSNGYLICPIHPADKRPWGKQWGEHPLTQETINDPPSDCGIGIICGKGRTPVYAIDLDTTDEGLGDRVLKRLFVEFPQNVTIQERVGLWPKRLLCYRGREAGWTKMRSRVFKRNPQDRDEKGQQLEILGAGQQFVTYGIYPPPKDAGPDYETHEYAWSNDWMGADPVQTPAAELVELTDDMRQAAIRIFEEEAAAAGLKPTTEASPQPVREEEDVLSVTDLPLDNFTIEDAERTIRRINPDLGPGSHDKWVKIGMCLHYQFQGSPEALALWDRLSAELGPDAYEPGACEKRWQSFHSERGGQEVITFRSLIWEARSTLAPLDDRLDETGIFARLMKRFGQQILITNQLGQGLLFFNAELGRWELEAGESYIRGCIRSIWEKGLLKEAADADDKLPPGADPKKDKSDRQRIEEFRERCMKQAASLQDRVMKLLRSEPQLVTKLEEFDTNPRYLGVGNGVLDLETFSLVPNTPSMRVLRRTEVRFDPTATCPVWDHTILSCFNGDAEKVKAFYRFVGSALTGELIDEHMGIARGGGANGKTLVLNTVAAVFGGYSEAVVEETLMGAKMGNAGGPRSDLAKLRGARFVYCSETTEGNRLREADVKRLTGRDPVPCRAPFGRQEIMIRPSWRLMIATNYRPVIRGDEDAIWRRITDFEFPINFQTDPRYHEDPKLNIKLRAEYSGILNRMLEGLRDYRARDGDIAMTDAMRQAVLEYRSEMDDIRMWFELECVFDKTLDDKDVLKDEDMFRRFSAWLERQGEKQDYTMKQFRRRVARLMPVDLRYRGKGNRWRLRKYRFKDADEDEIMSDFE